MKILAILLSIAILLGGCATMQSVVGQKDKGLTEIYAITKNEAYVISKKVLLEVGANVKQEDEEKGEIYAETGFEFGSYGTYIGIWIEPSGEKEVLVTIYTKRALATTVKTGLSQSQFHDEFKKYLD